MTALFYELKKFTMVVFHDDILNTCFPVPPVVSSCCLKTGRFMFPYATDRVGHQPTTRKESGTTAGRWLPWQQRHI